MYMSDLDPEDGGETVFPDGWPPYLAEEDRVSKDVVSKGRGLLLLLSSSFYCYTCMIKERK